MTPFLPRLRADVRVEIGDSVVVTDPLFLRRLDLGAVADVLGRLDGRPAEAFADDARAESVIRTLLLLQLLDGAGADVRARLAEHLAGRAPLPVTALPGARFSCLGSGACCKGILLGPLTDEDVARVSALDLTPFELPGPFYVSVPRPDGRVDRFLRPTADGRCSFLDAEDRCGLHARYGGASKPGFCQLFPLVAWATPRGIRVHDGGECASFPESARDGEPLLAQYERLRALVPARPVPQPLVHLGPGAPCDLTWWLPVQDRLVALVRDDAAPGDTLRVLAAFTERAAAALRRCPLAADGPDSALAALPDPADLPAAAPTDAGRAALAAVAGALAQAFAEPLARGGPVPPYTTDIAGALARVADAAAGGAPLPPEDPAARGLWAAAFRQRLYGPRALVEGRPRAALLRLTLGWLLARAHPQGDRAGHTVAARRLDMPWSTVHSILVRADGDTPAMIEVAATL